ncbi:hypothetical protein QYM36_004316, partial [Artemia franciscana]
DSVDLNQRELLKLAKMHHDLPASYFPQSENPSRTEKLENQRMLLEKRQKNRRQSLGVAQSSLIKKDFQTTPIQVLPVIGQSSDCSKDAPTKIQPSVSVLNLADTSESENEEDEESCIIPKKEVMRSTTSDSLFTEEETLSLTKPSSADSSRSLKSVLPTHGFSASLSHLCSSEIIENLEHFVYSVPPKGVLIQCRVTRDRKGVDRGLYPTYFVHMEREDGRKIFLLAARKRKKSRTSNYAITTDPTDLARHGDSYIGKLRSNTVGTCFTLYDNGEKRPARSELGVMLYDTNVLGFKGPRKMTAILPHVDDSDTRSKTDLNTSLI